MAPTSSRLGTVVRQLLLGVAVLFACARVSGAVDCTSRLVRIDTGKDTNCAGGNSHYYPVGGSLSDCHAWSATDDKGEQHYNSADNIQCHEDGTFSFTQHTNMDCSGTGTLKTFEQDVCHQDIPPVLYSRGADLSCCTDPTGSACLTGVPSVSVPGEIFLNFEQCDSPISTTEGSQGSTSKAGSEGSTTEETQASTSSDSKVVSAADKDRPTLFMSFVLLLLAACCCSGA
eukprot:gb/GFBE01073884.1/.p1 GENE.gb/GFBE01073884.1/~~gb/GFBE01073884.1/.p1  ORF type:complete len:230 (+),score=28.10 gb/GFBE01073884.1/:1-690(+)